MVKIDVSYSIFWLLCWYLVHQQPTQISLVIKLVIVQQALLTQISLVIKLNNATSAYNSFFIKLGIAQQMYSGQIYLN
jgi:ABC-type protease/lipase transport system fused ATPase/permease subunit